jgi:hypothetical protein
MAEAIVFPTSVEIPVTNIFIGKITIITKKGFFALLKYDYFSRIG